MNKTVKCALLSLSLFISVVAVVVIVTSTSRLVGKEDSNNDTGTIMIYVNDPEVEVIHNSTEINDKAELIGSGQWNKDNKIKRTWEPGRGNRRPCC